MKKTERDGEGELEIGMIHFGKGCYNPNSTEQSGSERKLWDWDVCLSGPPQGPDRIRWGKAAIAWVSDSLPTSAISPPAPDTQRHRLQERPWERTE